MESPSPADPSGHFHHQPEETALAECLASLPEHSARLVRRRYFDEADMDRLSVEFRQSPAALYQSLSRLRRRLADCIRQRLYQESGDKNGTPPWHSGERGRHPGPADPPGTQISGPVTTPTLQSLPFPS